MDELTSLLLAARDGDRVALGAVIRRTQAEVWRLCRHLVDAEDADDLTQEVYLRAWRSLPGFRGDASARTWLLTIARNTCAEAIRKRRRRRLLSFRTTPADTETVLPDPSGNLAVQSLLAALDDDQRAAFTLTQLHGLSYAETAEVCGCPVGTVRSRVARARTHLIELLAEASAQ
jgi:RNA polymerase sigma-70 factor (ECF subfamily)